MFKRELFKKDVSLWIGDKPLRLAATQLKVSASMLSRIRNGKLPSLNTLNLLCKQMNQPIERYFE